MKCCSLLVHAVRTMSGDFSFHEGKPFINTRSGGQIALVFCPFCGVKLTSLRAIQPEIDEREYDEATKMIKVATTISDFCQLLGKPVERSVSEPSFVKEFVFNKYWRTIEIVVRQRTDGSLAFFIGPLE